jgi:hypothetical protein
MLICKFFLSLHVLLIDIYLIFGVVCGVAGVSIATAVRSF